MKKLFLLLLTVMTLSLCASAQTRVVRGTVLDAENNEPLIGVSVSAGTGYGAATDIDGQFSVTVPASTEKLTISYVGYETKHVTITGSDLTIHLEPANSLLDPVIVVAYGEQKKSSFTGSAAVVGSAEIEKTQVTNVLDALNGKVAGLQLSNSSGAPGASSPTIRVRGFSSIMAGNAPLVIVDGSPYSGDINSINTNDIESMSVLKDAASNALYGARGANGVILITTKRARAGEASITFDAKWGNQSRASQDYDYITDPRQYMETYYSALYNYAVAAPQTYYNGASAIEIGGKGMSPADATVWANKAMFDGGFSLGYNIFSVPNGELLIGYDGKFNPNATIGRTVSYKGQDYYLTADDWMDATYKNSLRQEYSLNITQGTEKSNFMASVSYLDTEGIVKTPSSFKRFTGRLNADVQAKPWLKVGANIAYSHVNSEDMNSDEGSSSSSGNIFAYATQMAPIYPLYMRNGNGEIMVDNEGITRYDYGDGLNGGMRRPFLTGTNAISDGLLEKNGGTFNTFSAKGFVEIRFLKDFKFTSNNTVDLYEQRYTQTKNMHYGQFAPQGGIVSKQHMRQTSYTFQQLLNWNHVFNGRHNVSVLLGHEYYKTEDAILYASKSNIFLPENDELNGAIIDGQSSGSYTTLYNNEGWLGRAMYDLDSKYFFSASYRRDASSRFHPDHRWGSFWSAGGAWLISKEDFFNVDWVDLLKFKISYGEQGNDNIGNFRYINTYSLVNSNGSPSVNPSTKGNEYITWEKGGNFNTGFEFELFNNRLSGNLEFFHRKTTDMLMSFPLPASSGFMGYYANVGDMTNTGIEIELQGDVIRTRDFRWTINGNLTWYKNRISKLPEERKGQMVDGKYGYSSGSFFYGEDCSMYTYRMKKYAGVNPDNGLAMYYKNVTDASGNPTGEVTTTHDYSSADMYLCGTALAPVYGGFGTSFEYKDFDLSFAFNYQIGGQVYDGNYAGLLGNPVASASGSNIHADVLKAWTPENPNSNIPRWQATDQYSNASSDRFLLNASYLSLDNINFGYTLPNSVVRKLSLSKLRVYLTASNIWVWSKRQGVDPRQSFTGSVNNAYHAPIRTISGGLTVSF